MILPPLSLSLFIFCYSLFHFLYCRPKERKISPAIRLSSATVLSDCRFLIVFLWDDCCLCGSTPATPPFAVTVCVEHFANNTTWRSLSFTASLKFIVILLARVFIFPIVTPEAEYRRGVRVANSFLITCIFRYTVYVNSRARAPSVHT